MERVPARAGVAPPVEAAHFAGAVSHALAEVERNGEHSRAIDAAVGALHESLPSVFPSVFVVEHGRLWLVAQRGYALVPDGFEIGLGIMGRAIRLGRAQLVSDVRSDPDYLEALPAVTAELAVPIWLAGRLVGAINVESERALPEASPALVRPLAEALAPRLEALRTSGMLDLSALARLFVYLGTLRDPGEIAALAAASLARVLRVDGSQVFMWHAGDAPLELAAWRLDTADTPLLSGEEAVRARDQVDAVAVCHQFPFSSGAGARAERGLVWLPLRANGATFGALVGVRSDDDVNLDPRQIDAAAVLAAHVAASLDATLTLRRERQSAVTDPLTRVLNRRGLEERLEVEITAANERRLPLSVLVLDCDDFKEINDRAGHAFGDALLQEVADVLSASVPEAASVARLGGDEFVVVLPGADEERVEAVGARVRSVLAEGLTEAGFPLRVSAGISTYPFDGATPTELLRAADQALYAAKAAGKDRVATFRDTVGRELQASGEHGPDAARGARRDGSILADALTAAAAIDGEETVDGVLARLCKSLVFVVGATGCSTSRVDGEFLVDAAGHALREISLGHDAAYRIADFPLTEEVLRTGEPRGISFADADVDPAEAFILRELDMKAMLMVPLRVRGEPWGLIELYEMRLRRFSQDDISVSRFLASQAERRLDILGAADAPLRPAPVYELPSSGEGSRTPPSR